MTHETHDGYDFGGAKFDLAQPGDREIVRFILSQALFGEATGVYCGKSLYAARSLPAARFYLRQARQELGHLQLFAQIFRLLELQPLPGHWMLRVMSSHNNYYPLKVLMEHAVGEGMVLDVFKDLLLQTLPESSPAESEIQRKLHVICREEAEHVAWGESETVRMLGLKPWLRTPFFGIVCLELWAVRLLVSRFRKGYEHHSVLRQLEPFLAHVSQRVLIQGRRLGYVPKTAPGWAHTVLACVWGLLLLVRSRFARSRSQLDKTYLRELGFVDGSK